MKVHLIMHKSLRHRLYNPLNKDSGTMNWINWSEAIERLDVKLSSGRTITKILVTSGPAL